LYVCVAHTHEPNSEEITFSASWGAKASTSSQNWLN